MNAKLVSHMMIVSILLTSEVAVGKQNSSVAMDLCKHLKGQAYVECFAREVDAEPAASGQGSRAPLRAPVVPTAAQVEQEARIKCAGFGYSEACLVRAREAVKIEWQRRQQYQAAKDAADQRVQIFADRHGVTEGWVKWQSFRANPFAFEGQVLLFNTSLQSMTSPSEGLFSEILFVDIPRNAIVDQRNLVIAGKVIGVTRTKVGPYDLQVPKVRYLGHMLCQTQDCSDLGSWRSKR